jgi:hypothetical protein
LAAVELQVMTHTRSGIHVLSGAARWRGWLVGTALLAVFGLLLQPECYAWATEQGPARVTAQKGSGVDECCVIEAMTGYSAPLPVVASWNVGLPLAAPPVGNGNIALVPAAGALQRAVEHPPDRRAPYPARSARLLL